MFWEILQNSQESTYARVCNFIKNKTLAQVFSSEFWKISKNIFSYRTPPLTDSESTFYGIMYKVKSKNSI